VAGGVAGLGIGMAVVTDGSELGIGMLVIGMVAAVALLGYFYTRFRYGDEILEGALDGKGLKTGRTQTKIQTVYNETYDHFN
jgi:hypothetical protein